MSIPPSSAATPRSANLAVPASQNTAPVVKFRCLYTHDMRRKAKRWQDGFLRYHTFNKRVMVYDNTGYFIGDLHWRAPEGIQDGDELELDKGALIQVCEPLEQTETDISSLYKNKSQPSPSHPGNAPPSVRSTPRPPLSQQAPRSLNDLLGIKKGSTPQLLSPYEQRNGIVSSGTDQVERRPSKRQRTSPERDRTSEQGVVDLSDSPTRKQQESIPNARPKAQKQSNTPSANQLPTKKPSDTAPKQVQAASSRPQAAPQVQKAHQSSGSSANTLRLSSDKPRRKLMYQEPAAPLKPEPQSQLPRTNSQSLTREHEATSPVIVLDDDPPDPPRIPRPARADLTRSVSMVDAVDDTDDLTLAFKSSSDDEFPHVSNASIPLPQPGAPSSVPRDRPPINAKPRSAGLRKSFSDPSTINNVNTRPLPASPLNLLAEGSDEQGPWTSEALDLFDFWPPGRPKPV